MHRDRFEKISKTYDEVHDRVASAVYAFLQWRYYGRCSGKRVLDVGNGGRPPAEALGGRIAESLTCFVGLDESLAMLERKAAGFTKLVADGLDLPFNDKSFDYVLINGVLHHLGYESRESSCRRIQRLIGEALRVCSREVIAYELFTLPFFETVERVVARMIGSMRTFVLSEETLDRTLQGQGVERSEVESRSLAELTHRFYWYPVLLDYPWLRLPASLSPFHHGFFVIRKPQGNVPHSRNDGWNL